MKFLHFVGNFNYVEIRYKYFLKWILIILTKMELKPHLYNKPIFIVGCPRSGTTLLQCMLSANADAFSLPETHYFSSILHVLKLKANDLLDYGMLNMVLKALQIANNLVLPEHISEKLRKRAEMEQVLAIDVFCELVEFYRPEYDKRKHMRFIEKTPLHLYYLEEILNLFSFAQVVNIVRDPRDVVSSLLKMPNPRSHSVRTYTNSWIDCLKIVAMAEAQYPGKIMTIRYEDLAANTELVLKNICEFLSLRFSSYMITDYASESNKCVMPHEGHKKEVIQGGIVNKVGVWRARIGPGEAWLVEQMATTIMHTLKYATDANPTRQEIIEAQKKEEKTLCQEKVNL